MFPNSPRSSFAAELWRELAEGSSFAAFYNDSGQSLNTTCRGTGSMRPFLFWKTHPLHQNAPERLLFVSCGFMLHRSTKAVTIYHNFSHNICITFCLVHLIHGSEVSTLSVPPDFRKTNGPRICLRLRSSGRSTMSPIRIFARTV